MKVIAMLCISAALSGCAFSVRSEGRICAGVCADEDTETDRAAVVGKDVPAIETMPAEVKTRRAYVDASLSSEQAADVLDALDAWHTLAGAELYEATVLQHAEVLDRIATTEHDSHTVLLVLARTPEECGAAPSHQAVAYQSGALVCFIADRMGSSRWLWQATARHELGHYFGLGHVTDWSGPAIMHPIASSYVLELQPLDVAAYKGSRLTQ
jgi:hypothetical protein